MQTRSNKRRDVWGGGCPVDKPHERDAREREDQTAIALE